MLSPTAYSCIQSIAMHLLQQKKKIVHLNTSSNTFFSMLKKVKILLFIC